MLNFSSMRMKCHGVLFDPVVCLHFKYDVVSSVQMLIA